MSSLGKEFSVLPRAEIARLLGKYRIRKEDGGRGSKPNNITLMDIARECHTTRYRLYSILDGTPMDKDHELGDTVLRRVSRFLMRCEAGLIEKKAGKMIFHPEPTKPPETVHRLLFYDNGRPVVRIGLPHPTATNFPRFFAADPLNNRSKG